jgi:hypothetical protein
MTSISTYTVEHYQFNCAEDSVGEGAVMLLVKTTGSTDTIAKAVLIDCGYAGNSVVRLKDLLARLQTRFGGKVKFDAVSISHWDKVRPSLVLHRPCKHMLTATAFRITTGMSILD